MFYINDIKLTKSEEFKDEWEFYQEKIKEIKSRKHIPKGDTYYVFEDPSPIRIGSNGTHEPKQGILILSDANFMGARWNLCKRSSVDKTGRRTYDPTSEIFRDKKRLNPDKPEDLEKIFFYLHLSPIVKNCLRLQNKEEEAKKLNEKESDEVAVKFYIFHDHSPLSLKSNDGSDRKLRDVAYSWQISNAESIPVEMLKRSILDAVQSSEKRKDSTKRGYNEFIKEVQNLEIIELKKNIQILTDKGVIEYVENKWRYKMSDKTIVIVAPQYYNNPVYALEKELNKNPFTMKEFTDQLAIVLTNETYGPRTPSGKIIEHVYSEEELNSMDEVRLREVVKEIKVFLPPTAKKETMINKILGVYKDSQ